MVTNYAWINKMPAFANCSGSQEERNQHCPAQVAWSLQPSKARRRKRPGLRNCRFLCWQEEGAEAMTGGACRTEGKGGVLGEAGSVVKMGKTRRPQAEPGALKI